MSRERDATGAALAARGETPAAFGRRCIPAPPHGAQSAPWGPRADCVAPPSNIPDILGRHALSAGRLAALGATLEFHHGLPGDPREKRQLILARSPAGCYRATRTSKQVAEKAPT